MEILKKIKDFFLKDWEEDDGTETLGEKQLGSVPTENKEGESGT